MRNRLKLNTKQLTCSIKTESYTKQQRQTLNNNKTILSYRQAIYGCWFYVCFLIFSFSFAFCLSSHNVSPWQTWCYKSISMFFLKCLVNVIAFPGQQEETRTLQFHCILIVNIQLFLSAGLTNCLISTLFSIFIANISTRYLLHNSSGRKWNHKEMNAAAIHTHYS